MELAVWGIGMAQTPAFLRSTWAHEARHREEYGLSDDQIAELVRLCKLRVIELEENAAAIAADQKPTRSRSRPARRGAAI
jgi:hypothetical protein